MGVFTRLFGQKATTEPKPVLDDSRVKLQYQAKPTDPVIKFGRRKGQLPVFRFKGDPISRATFDRVKKSITALRRGGSKFNSVTEIAKHDNIGRSRAYRLAKTDKYEDMHGDNS